MIGRSNLSRPIYPVGSSQIRRLRAFTLEIFTADCSWEHFCFASVEHRTSIDRQSDVSRATFVGVGRPSADDQTTGYTEIYVCTCILYYYTGSSYLKYLDILYMYHILSILMCEWIANAIAKRHIQRYFSYWYICDSTYIYRRTEEEVRHTAGLPTP